MACSRQWRQIAENLKTLLSFRDHYWCVHLLDIEWLFFNPIHFWTAFPPLWPPGNYVLSFLARVLDRGARLRNGSSLARGWRKSKNLSVA